MPSRATHHNDDASKTISNRAAGNGKAIALAHRNRTCPRISDGGAAIADLMSGSLVSTPITDLGCDAY